MPRQRTEKKALNGDGLKCPYCREISHFDEILDYEYELYELEKSKQND